MRSTEQRKAEKIAARLGVTLGIGLSVNGHHGNYSDTRCGSYDLVVNVDAERVDCLGCGATDLVRAPRKPLPERVR